MRCASQFSKSGGRPRVIPKTCRPLEPTTAAYIAGYLDGEGMITLVREMRAANTRGWRLAPRVALFNTHLGSLEWVQAQCGVGTIRELRLSAKARGKFPNAKQCYSLSFPSNAIRTLLPQIVGHLRIKRIVADLMLEYLGMAAQGMKFTPEEEIRAWEIANEMQQRRVRNARPAVPQE